MNNEFASWLDNVIENNELPEGAAVNFNIYEEGDNEWSLQLIVAGHYDEEDMDWACDEAFTSEEDIYTWTQETGWEEVQSEAFKMINEYLEEGKNSEKLKSYGIVAAGFIDGVIEILFKA